MRELYFSKKHNKARKTSVKLISIALNHLPPFTRQTRNSVPIELWLLGVEKVGQPGFQVLFVIVDLVPHGVAQHGEQMMISWR